MKALNNKERKKANIKFIAVFVSTLAAIFICSFFVLHIALKGVKVLEDKHATYNKAFENQALVTFRIEEIIDKIYNLKQGTRNINEQKNFQGLISNIRLDLEKVINDEQTTLKEFALFEKLLLQVTVIQTSIDLFKEDEESRRYSQELLERCRENYREKSLKEGKIKDED